MAEAKQELSARSPATQWALKRYVLVRGLSINARCAVSHCAMCSWDR